MNRLTALYPQKRDMIIDFILLCVFVLLTVACLAQFFSVCNEAPTLYPDENFGYLDLSTIIFLDCLSAYFMLSVIVRHISNSSLTRVCYYGSIPFLLLLPSWLINHFYLSNLIWSSYRFFENPALIPFVFSVVCLLIPLYGNQEKERCGAWNSGKLSMENTKSAVSAVTGGKIRVLFSQLKGLYDQCSIVLTDFFIIVIYILEAKTFFQVFFSDRSTFEEIFPDKHFGPVYMHSANLLICLSAYFMLSVLIRHVPYGKAKRCYYSSVAILSLVPLWLIPKFHLDNLPWSSDKMFFNPAIFPFLFSTICVLVPLYQRYPIKEEASLPKFQT